MRFKRLAIAAVCPGLGSLLAGEPMSPVAASINVMNAVLGGKPWQFEFGLFFQAVAAVVSPACQTLDAKETS